MYINMKFLETHFEEYIQTAQKKNLHVKMDKLFNKFLNSVFFSLFEDSFLISLNVFT